MTSRTVTLGVVVYLFGAACASGGGDDDTSIPDADDTAEPTDTVGPGDSHVADGDSASGGGLSVATVLSEPAVVAGSLVAVTCDVVDGGEPVALPTIVEASPALDLELGALLAARAGTYVLTCRLADAARDADAAHTPATLVISAAPPDRIAVTISPPQPVYGVGQTITVEATATDAWGNPSGDPVAVSPEPAGAAEALDGQDFRLSDSAVFAASTSVSGETLSGARFVAVDTIRPVVTFDAPAPGATLSGSTDVTVSGVVFAAGTEVETATLDGEPLAMDANGAFSATMTSRAGLNIARVVATDAAGNVGEASTSWLWSVQYLPFDALQSFMPTTRFDARLPAATLGDGSFDEPPNDLVDALLREGVEVATDPITRVKTSGNSVYLSVGGFGPVCTVFDDITREPIVGLQEVATAVQLTGVAADTSAAAPVVTPQDGALSVSWAGRALLTVEGSVTIDYWRFNLLGNCSTESEPGQTTTYALPPATLEVGFDAHATISLSKASGLPVATGFNVDVTVTSYPVLTAAWTEHEFAWGTADSDLGAPPPTTHTKRGTLGQLLAVFDVEPAYLLPSGPVDDRVHDAVTALLQTRLVDALFDDYAFDQVVATGAEPVASLERLALLDRATLSADGIALTWQGVVSSDPDEGNDPGPGSLLRGGCGVGPVATATPADPDAIGFGFHLDLLNRALYQAWLARSWPYALDPAALGAATDAADTSVRAVAVTIATRPPVFDDCGADGALHLVAGDVMVDLLLRRHDRTYTASTRATVSASPELRAGPEGVRLVLDGLEFADAVTSSSLDDDDARDAAERIALGAIETALFDTLGNQALAVLELPRWPFPDGRQLEGPLVARPGFVWTTPCDPQSCPEEAP